eukprot:COSAG02_NODE_1183_length_14014_cov_4.551707_1_plen_462_part_00
MRHRQYFRYVQHGTIAMEPEPESELELQSPNTGGTAMAGALPNDAIATAAHAACSWWYPRVAGRGATLKSTLLPLPSGFANFLLQDGVVLPPSFREGADAAAEDSWSDQSETDSDSDTEDDDIAASSRQPADFPELAAKLQAAIDTSGRAGVFPRLTWSAPTDAAWIAADSTLSCHTPAQVLLLLKSSDKVAEDLSRQDVPHCILLRKYRSINAALEFRCFVKDERVVAITQLRCDQRFSLLQDVTARASITEAILSTYEQRIRSQLPPNIVLDMYVEQRSGESDANSGYRAWLTDVEAFDSATDALLFTWDEVQSMEGLHVCQPCSTGELGGVDVPSVAIPELRVITMELPILPSQKVTGKRILALVRRDAPLHREGCTGGELQSLFLQGLLRASPWNLPPTPSDQRMIECIVWHALCIVDVRWVTTRHGGCVFGLRVGQTFHRPERHGERRSSRPIVAH